MSSRPEIAHISGHKLFRYELRIRRKVRTTERWQPSPEAAQLDAERIAEEWAEGGLWSVRAVREVSPNTAQT